MIEGVSGLPCAPHYIISYLGGQINELRSNPISLLSGWWQFKWKISYLLWADRWVGADGCRTVGGEELYTAACTSVYTIVTQDPVHCWEWAYSVTWIYSKLQGAAAGRKWKVQTISLLSLVYKSLSALLIRFYYLHQSQQKNVCQFRFKIFKIM